MKFGWQTYVLGISFCALWSSAFTVGKFAIQAAPPLWFLTIRFALAFVIMYAVIAILRRKLPQNRRDWITAIWLGLLNNGAYLGLCYIAFKTTSSGMVAMIASLMPLVTAALAWPILGEALNARKLLGLAFGIGGAWFILGFRLSGSGAQIDDPFGLILATIGMFCLACGTVLYKKRGADADPMGMNAVQALAASVVLLPAAFLLEVPDITFGWTFIWTQAYTAIVMTFGALLLWFALIRQAGAGAASTFHFLNPGIAFLIAWVALGEPIHTTDIIGLLPVAIGILLVNWPARKTKTVPA